MWDHCVGSIARPVCIVAQRCRRCNSCGFDTPLRELRVGDTFQDRRQPGHQDAAAGGTARGQHSLRARQYLQENLWTTGPLPNCAIRDVVLTERDKQLLPELRRASAMALPRCVVSRYTTAWADSLKVAMSGHQSWASLCRYCCRLLLAEISEGAAGLARSWDSRILGRVAEQQGRRSRRQTNSAGSDPVP